MRDAGPYPAFRATLSDGARRPVPTLRGTAITAAVSYDDCRQNGPPYCYGSEKGLE